MGPLGKRECDLRLLLTGVDETVLRATWCVGHMLQYVVPGRQVRVRVGIDVGFNVRCCGHILWITTDHLVLRILVDSDVVDSHFHWPLRSETYPIDVTKVQRDTALEDEIHGFVRDGSIADLGLGIGAQHTCARSPGLVGEEGGVSNMEIMISVRSIFLAAE